MPRLSPARFLPAAVGACLILLFFWRLAFTNLILSRGDVLLYFYPYWDYRAEMLRAGRLPLWNPYLFMGAPFLANSQAGVLYPPNWPLVFFSAPTAFKVSILAHLALAWAGAYYFARRRLGQSALGAGWAASLLALGGYLTAQVEHVNQLQGLAWFPWLLLADGLSDRRWAAGGVGSILAMQLLAGHTQTVFISAAAFIVWRAISDRATASRGLAVFGIGLLLAAGLAAAQLLPTWELSRESLRSGGLPWREAVSFSLDPRLVGRALLPGYSRPLFTEFVAHLGLAGLASAALGLGRSRRRLALAAMAALGLLLALGLFNPLYALLANFPPFNLFRAPARWLFLFAFGGAMLAGHGVDQLRSAGRIDSRRAAITLAALAGLIAAAYASTGLIAPGETGPLAAPAAVDLAGWGAALALSAALLLIPASGRRRAPALAALGLIELAIASQALPFNQLTTPDAYTSIRPAMTQLLSHRSEIVPGRVLSMSTLRFDPGDLAELRSALEPQLPPEAVYDAIVAAKHKEVLSHNLPLAWRLPSLDGYDGGLLPLRRYALFAERLGASAADGRLSESLAAAPDPRLLSLVNARWLIADKVQDAWLDGVFYDLQFTLTLTEGETFEVMRLPAFEATALGIVLESAGGGTLHVEFADGAIVQQPLAGTRVRWGQAGIPVRLRLAGPATVRGLSLIDERTGDFQSLTVGPYRLAHSGDVKIYENLNVLPRAFVAAEGIVIADDDLAGEALTDRSLDLARTVVLAAVPEPPSPAAGPSAPVEFVEYTAEHIRLRAEGPGYLVLTDAFYPGWVAAVDGRPVPILRADLLFRAVALPPGAHTVEFRFAPASVTIGGWLSAAAWSALIIAAVWTARRSRRGAAQSAA